MGYFDSGDLYPCDLEGLIFLSIALADLRVGESSGLKLQEEKSIRNRYKNLLIFIIQTVKL